MTLKALGGRKLDRRSLRSQRMLREALAEELTQAGDLSRVTVAALTERAGLTRRTFYSHYKDIPDFIERVEGTLLDEVRAHVEVIAAASLDDLYRHIEDAVPAPGSVELLRYLKENGALIGALLGPGGDQAFIEKVTCMAREVVSGRMQTGILPQALGAFFDYYLVSVISSEVGIVQRWFQNGLRESPETMARIMTVVAFVRPGDLYGKPIDINVPAYGLKLMSMKPQAPSGAASQPEPAAPPAPTGSGAPSTTPAER